MADRGYIPSSPACGRWETLLTEALDGQLRPEDEAAFTSHMAGCRACTELFEESRRGRQWLEFLAPEPEIPEGLLNRLLAATGPGQLAGFGLVSEGAAVAAMPKPWQRPGFGGHVRRYAEPRLLMTAAMAFFSIALTLNLLGFKFDQVRMSDLRPSAVRSVVTRRIVTASVPLIRYYDRLRFLYEVESSMRQLRGGQGENETPQQAQPANPQTPKKGTGKNGGSRVESPQRPGSRKGAPEVRQYGDILDASLNTNGHPPALASLNQSIGGGNGLQSVDFRGSQTRARERGWPWIA